MREEERPSLIRVKSIIGWPSPNKQGTSKAHGAPLGEDEVRLTKEVLGWDPDQHFFIPDEVREHFDQRERGAALQAEWNAALPGLARRPRRARRPVGRRVGGQAAARRARGARGHRLGARTSSPPRSAGQQAMAAFSDYVPTMVGGAADLSESTKTEFPGGHELNYKQGRPARNVFFGVREHGMGGVVNGMAGHGGIVRPYGSTFLQFADYMRGSIRLSALMGLEDAWVYTHDSVGLGEDGPTHQPVEHLAALRAIPRPRGHPPGRRQRDGRGVADDPRGPRRARGADPLAPGPADPARRRLRRRRARRLRAARRRRPRGGDRGHRVGAVGRHRRPPSCWPPTGSRARVVSMPSWELFAAQDDAYRDAVLPPGLPSVAVEAGVSQGWERWVDRVVAIDRFGASAPGALVLEKLGITAENTARAARELLGALTA